MDDDEDLIEFLRVAEIAARHSARASEMLEQWLADPVRDPLKLRLAEAEARLLDQAMADVEASAFVGRARRRRLP
jgi:hypothetical protein